MIINDSVIELTPEEAMHMAERLLQSARIVMERRQKMPAAYDYQTFAGHDPNGQFGRLFKVRVGKETL